MVSLSSSSGRAIGSSIMQDEIKDEWIEAVELVFIDHRASDCTEAARAILAAVAPLIRAPLEAEVDLLKGGIVTDDLILVPRKLDRSIASDLGEGLELTATQVCALWATALDALSERWREWHARSDAAVQADIWEARYRDEAAEVERLRPYVEAFRREETRADRLGGQVDDMNDIIAALRADLAQAQAQNEALRKALGDCLRYIVSPLRMSNDDDEAKRRRGIIDRAQTVLAQEPSHDH